MMGSARESLPQDSASASAPGSGLCSSSSRLQRKWEGIEGDSSLLNLEPTRARAERSPTSARPRAGCSAAAAPPPPRPPPPSAPPPAPRTSAVRYPLLPMHGGLLVEGSVTNFHKPSKRLNTRCPQYAPNDFVDADDRILQGPPPMSRAQCAARGLRRLCGCASRCFRRNLHRPPTCRRGDRAP
jgi:hypothetical protein